MKLFLVLLFSLATFTNVMFMVSVRNSVNDQIQFYYELTTQRLQADHDFWFDLNQHKPKESSFKIPVVNI